MGYFGNKYTWRHGSSVETRRAIRLDRALCCDVWRRRFPLASVRHLGHAHSDHCPLLVELGGATTTRLGHRPCKFQAAWLEHVDFFNILEKERSRSGDLLYSMKCLTEKLTAWNRDMLGNIFKRKQRLRSRLEGVIRVLDVKA